MSEPTTFQQETAHRLCPLCDGAEIPDGGECACSRCGQLVEAMQAQERETLDEVKALLDLLESFRFHADDCELAKALRS